MGLFIFGFTQLPIVLLYLMISMCYHINEPIEKRNLLYLFIWQRIEGP